MLDVDQSTPPRGAAYTYLSVLFVGTIVAANLMGTKVIPFFTIAGFEFTGSVGIFLFPISFLVTDIMTEIWGGKSVRSLIGATVVVLLLILAVTALATILPPADRFAGTNEAYLTIFRSSPRITIASIVAFSISQVHDVWAFELWKRITRGRMLWLRNNASTMVSQLIDSVVFMLIAFWMVGEQFTLGFVLGSMLPPYYVLKMLMALLDTPFVYLGVHLLRGETRRRGAAPEVA
ncbi:MAG: queuosine precursor transporter [Alkalispirochaeta sp.]